MNSDRPASTARHCTAILEETGIQITLAANTPITILHHGADQDGWDGELMCRMENGHHAAFEPGDVSC